MAQSISGMSTHSSLAPKISLRAVQLCVGLTPFLMVPGIEEYTLLPRLLLLQLATFAAALAWAYQVRAFPLRYASLHVPAIAFFLILSASVLWAINPFRATYDLSKHLTFLLLFFVITHTLNRTHIPSILKVSAIAGALVSLIGIGEYLGLMPLWIPSTGRPSSTFGFRNLAASYLVANLPLSGLFFLTSHRLRDRLIGGLSASLMLVFLLYTRGRGAWVGLFAATVFSMVLWIIVSRKTLLESFKTVFDRPALAVAAGSLLLVAVLGPLSEGFKEHHIQRFDEKKADIPSAVTSIFKRGGSRGRPIMWRSTLQMVRDAPLLGVGIGNWEYLYPLYDHGQMIEAKFAPLRPHNDLLWIWSEEGTLGLLAYLALLGALLLSIVGIWRQTADFRSQITAFACSITVWAVVGAGCFGFPRERIPPMLLFWLAFAVVGILSRDTATSPAPWYRPTRYARLAILIIPLLLLTSAWITVRRIGFDYYYINAVRASLKEDQPAVVQEGAYALSFGPFNHQIFVMLGAGQLELGNYTEALQTLHRGLAYHPYFANIYNNLGLLYDKREQSEKAISAYRKAIELVPNHYIARYNLGLAYQKAGQVDSAIIAYKKAFHSSHTKPYINLGALYRKQGRIDSAIVTYQAAISTGTPSPEAYYNLGNIYAEQHEYEKAAEAYGNFLSTVQENSEYVQMGRQGLGEAYSGLAVQAEQRGETDRAIETNKTALQYWPESAQIWFNLGNVYRQKVETQVGQEDIQTKKEAWNLAVHAYAQALGRDTTFVSAYSNLGMTYRDLGQYRKAVAVYRKALQFQPEEPIIYYNMGNAYIDLSDTTRALSAYSDFLKYWTGDPAITSAVRSMMVELKQK